MTRRIRFELVIPTLALAVVLSGCAQQQEAEQPGRPAVNKAVAVLHPTEGSEVHALVSFTREAEGVHVVAHVEGLEPGDHGFHIHEFGDCSAADATSAGGHYNPEDVPHGGPESPQHHVGDLGNITADENGVATLEQVFPFLSLGGQQSIIGRAVIVHADADDLSSQPTGAAGARLACGVVGIAQQ